MTSWLTRRQIIRLLGSSFLTTAASGLVALAAYTEASETSVEAWMDAWMKSRKVVSGPLHVSRFVEPIYFLLSQISWRPNLGQMRTYQAVDVPTGFVTDFASIPRLFWSMLRPDGEYAYAAVIHDFLYWTQTRSREEADSIFLLAMKDFDIAEVTVTTIYDAVRIGGGKAWKENAGLKLAGEKRVLKRFPEDPTMRWSNWKKQPNVFADRP
jgi:uncharacterized protein DUF1353